MDESNSINNVDNNVMAPIKIPRWDKLRRRQTVFDLYYGTGEFKGQAGMSIPAIAEVLGISNTTVWRDLQAMQATAGRAVARDEAMLERVGQNTLDVLADLEELDKVIWEEVELARQMNNRRGNFLPSLIATLTKNKELQAKVLRLLDPKIEISLKTEKAVMMQEAILKALQQVAPEVYEQVLYLAEKIYNEQAGNHRVIDVTPYVEEEGGGE